MSYKSVLQECPTRVSHKSVLEAKGGAKASAPEWESGGQRGRKKHGALFGGSRTEWQKAGRLAQVGRGKRFQVKSPLYVALCPDPPAREEREERRKDERQRGEREREREEREMRER